MYLAQNKKLENNLHITDDSDKINVTEKVDNIVSDVYNDTDDDDILQNREDEDNAFNNKIMTEMNPKNSSIENDGT